MLLALTGPSPLSLKPLLLALSLFAAAPALAQEPPRRAPDQRQIVTDLAYVLGEAHGLHRLCAGPADATWYAKMQQLLSAEAPDSGFRRRLVDSFNAGYQARQAEFPVCGKASQAAERAAAAHGASLARQLARARASE